ncbi:hypothetical protein WA026_023029 [Henosepilachna vigintioctopunctata]|uniref:ELM2 domain-containing protein n=1 Tax=Henosepilachna vigintioctopunctata TaxID=420089 RepID=A0AAW1VI69_9CUCU
MDLSNGNNNNYRSLYTQTQEDSIKKERKLPRIGNEYQAECPEFIPENQRNFEYYDSRKDLLMWRPSDISDEILENFIALSREKYFYTEEQVLGLLQFHQYDMDQVLLDIVNYSPINQEFSNHEKQMFEEGIRTYGKNFRKIKQLHLNKDIPCLVKYYYKWKNDTKRLNFRGWAGIRKTRSRYTMS